MSKLVAGREKDLAFLAALFRHRLPQAEIVRERLTQTSLPEAARALAADRLHRLAPINSQ